jgi:hypothetical protein
LLPGIIAVPGKNSPDKWLSKKKSLAMDDLPRDHLLPRDKLLIRDELQTRDKLLARRNKLLRGQIGVQAKIEAK